MNQHDRSRRKFIKLSGAFSGAVLTGGLFSEACFGGLSSNSKVAVDAHLWVYASRYPPNWDCTPILNDVFSDLKYAGYDKVELMEPLLKHEDSVALLQALIQKYDLPITGTSYYGDMWNKDQQQYILEDIEPVIQRLHLVGGSMIGLTVGDAKRTKTEKELDTQAETLKKIMTICAVNKIQPNLHNHTFEVVNQLHDLKGTLKRVPGIKLGPDLNWLVRGGVDPVTFIRTYGHQMVYMHIRDQRADGKWTEAVGEGVIDFKAIAKVLKEIGYKGRAAVELAFDDPPLRPVKEDWKLSREYVKKVFGW